MDRYGPEVALVVTDVQNDFADPAGALSVAGGDEVVEAANVEIEAARDAGALVVYTQDSHPSSTPHFAKDGGIWPVHCVQGSWGAAFHPRLLVVEGPVIRKGVHGEDGYSGFTVRDPRTGAQAGTDLEPVLRERGITRLVVLGLATDYCVKETVLDAVAKGFPSTVLRAGVRAVDLEPGDGERALAAMEAAGASIV